MVFSSIDRCNTLKVVVEAEMLHVSDGIPDGSTTTIQTGRNYGSGDHGLAPGLFRSSWIVRRRSSSRTSDRVETVRYINLPLLFSSLHIRIYIIYASSHFLMFSL